MLAGLVALHRRNQEETRASRPASSYRRILEHFEARGQRLRGERLVTAELMERLVEATRAVAPRRVQQELQILGPSGGVAAGRFRITNRWDRRAAFALVAGDPAEGSRPAVAFQAGALALDPGETRVVRVEARLDGLVPGSAVTVPVECRWDAGCDRLWLVVIAGPAADRLE
jgi:hypothetical protein